MPCHIPLLLISSSCFLIECGNFNPNLNDMPHVPETVITSDGAELGYFIRRMLKQRWELDTF